MGEASEVLVSLGGILDITGEVVVMWLIVALLAIISVLATRHMSMRPGKLQNIVETGIEYLDNMITDVLGKKYARQYFTYLASLFIFILFANYSGLIPGVGMTKYLKAPTSSLSTTAGLGILTFLFLQGAGLRHGVGSYFKRFVTPAAFMLPLLLIDELIKPLSLSLRLYGNIFGEETVTENFYEIFPIGAPAIMILLSLLFCAIQAMVYTLLVSIYLQEELGEE